MRFVVVLVLLDKLRHVDRVSINDERRGMISEVVSVLYSCRHEINRFLSTELFVCLKSNADGPFAHRHERMHSPVLSLCEYAETHTVFNCFDDGLLGVLVLQDIADAVPLPYYRHQTAEI